MLSALALKALAAAPLAADPIATFEGHILGDITTLIVIGVAIAAIVHLAVHRSFSHVFIVVALGGLILWFVTNWHVVVTVWNGIWSLA